MSEKNSKETKVLSIAEQEILAKEEVQKIVKMAKEKGKVTIEEINEALPQEILAASVLDAFMQSLEANGIVIMEHAETARADEKEEFITHTIANEHIYLYRFEGYQNGFYIDFQKHGDAANKPRYNIRILYRQFRPGKTNFTLGVAHNGLKAVATILNRADGSAKTNR